jgi:hypothetical protein
VGQLAHHHLIIGIWHHWHLVYHLERQETLQREAAAAAKKSGQR